MQVSIRTSPVFNHLSRGTSNRHGRLAPMAWSRPREEYAADFLLVSRRALTPEQFRLFEMHFLQGHDWMACAAKLGLSRGNFFHEVYRIQEKLGRVYAELQPYALYPPHAYFASIRTAPMPEGSTASGPKNAAPSPIPFPVRCEPETEPFVDDPEPQTPVIVTPDSPESEPEAAPEPAPRGAWPTLAMVAA